MKAVLYVNGNLLFDILVLRNAVLLLALIFNVHVENSSVCTSLL